LRLSPNWNPAFFSAPPSFCFTFSACNFAVILRIRGSLFPGLLPPAYISAPLVVLKVPKPFNINLVLSVVNPPSQAFFRVSLLSGAFIFSCSFRIVFFPTNGSPLHHVPPVGTQNFCILRLTSLSRHTPLGCRALYGLDSPPFPCWHRDKDSSF